MKTLIDVDEKVLDDIKKISGIKSKKEIINTALLEYSKKIKRDNLINSFGKLKTDFDVLENRELELKNE